MRLMIGGGVLLLVGILVALFFALQDGGASRDQYALSLVVKPAPVPLGPKPRSDESWIAEAEAVSTRFINALTVEEVLPLICHSVVSEPRLRKLYPDGRIPKQVLSAFNPYTDASVRGKIVSSTFRIGDEKERVMNFVIGNEGLKVDWESWAGWSEMTWEELIDQKPITAHVFRATLSAVDYYNFDFKDDQKWQSYQLVSPKGDHLIYGYVERDTPQDAQLRGLLAHDSAPVMISLKFPAGAVSNGQVLIEKLEREGWLDSND